MPCNFAGVFSVKEIAQYQLHGEFLDEYNVTRNVEMNYFRTSTSGLAKCPFKEMQVLQSIDTMRRRRSG